MQRPETSNNRVNRRLIGAALSLPQLWALTAVVLPIAVSVRTLSTPDLAYVVRAGEVMLRSGRLLRIDTFTFTTPGHGWLNQQWGAEIIFAEVFRWGDWIGLAILQVLLVGTSTAFLYLAIRAAGAHARRAASLVLAFLPVAFAITILRPQLLGLALFALTLWIVMRRRSHPSAIWAVPVIAAVWSNVHGSFFLAPVLLLLAWLEDVHARSPMAQRTLAAASLSAASTLINPFGVRAWAYALGITTNARITETIGEWQPPTIHQVTGALFFVSVIAVVVALLRRNRPVPWPHLVALGLFFVGGLVAVRGARWWAVAAPVYLAVIFSDTPPRHPPVIARSVLNTAIGAALIAVTIAALPWSLAGSRLPTGPQLQEAPAGLTRSLQTALHPGDRVFTTQRWGSWFELAFPSARYFVDSRIELFPESIWRDYDAVTQGRQGWQQILDRWDVDVLVVYRGTESDLIGLASSDPGWRMVYEDEDGAVFLRA